MIAVMLSCWAAALGAAPGEIAFIAAPPSAPERLQILTLETNTLRTIGPGDVVGPPAWSPDGGRIAVAARVPGGLSIFVANVDSGQGGYLKHAQPVNTGPVWSPDGTQLAYTAGDGLDAQIMVATLVTRDDRPWGAARTSLVAPVWTTRATLDRIFERLADTGRPRFLPSLPAGAKSPPVLLAIGFAGAAAARTTEIFLVSESEAVPLDAELMPSPGAYEESALSVSSEGIAFDSNDGGDREIFVIGRRKTWDAGNHAAADWQPLWSPDSRWLAFESFRGGTRGLYRCYQQSTRVTTIVSDPAADCWGAAWSPDSRWIAYTSNAGGAPSVWVVRAEGGGRERARISPLGTPAGFAAWRPGR